MIHDEDEKLADELYTMIFDWLADKENFIMFSTRRQIAKRTANKFLEEIQNTKALSKAYHSLDVDIKTSKVLDVYDIGKSRPYFEPDAAKVDKIKEMCS